MKTKDVEKLLKKHGKIWDEFAEFMHGQTVGTYPDGETNWYDCDVERFVGDQSGFRF